MPASSRDRSRKPSDVRAGNKMQMSPSRASRHSFVSRSKTGQRSPSTRPTSAATSAASLTRSLSAAEAVDRLLRVTEEEQATRLDPHLAPEARTVIGVRGAEQCRDLDLDRIGVLELVDEKTLVALAQPATCPGAVFRVAQKRACKHQQVVELELARSAAFRDRT